MLDCGFYYSLEPNGAELDHWSVFREALAMKASGRRDDAQALAVGWGQHQLKRVGATRKCVWKDIKRTLAACWFGAPERRTFPAGWAEEQVLAYLARFSGRACRVSVFEAGIACHAKSIRLGVSAREMREQLAELDHRDMVEAFPESSSLETVCFRRWSTALGPTVYYEAGLGQAEDVFEKHNAQQSLVSLVLDGNAVREEASSKSGDGRAHPQILHGLRGLIERRESALSAKTRGMCRALGLDYVSLEGYYDRGRDLLTVVDIDLRMDVIFMP